MCTDSVNVSRIPVIPQTFISCPEMAPRNGVNISTWSAVNEWMFVVGLRMEEPALWGVPQRVVVYTINSSI